MSSEEDAALDVEGALDEGASDDDGASDEEGASEEEGTLDGVLDADGSELLGLTCEPSISIPTSPQPPVPELEELPVFDGCDEVFDELPPVPEGLDDVPEGFEALLEGFCSEDTVLSTLDTSDTELVPSPEESEAALEDGVTVLPADGRPSLLSSLSNISTKPTINAATATDTATIIMLILLFFIFVPLFVVLRYGNPILKAVFLARVILARGIGRRSDRRVGVILRAR